MNITKMRINIIFLVLVSLAVVFSFGIGTVAADQSQIYVNTAGNDSWDGQSATWNGTSGPKFTVKNATSIVGANGIVYIANGMYNENGISITKNMSIIGESKQNTIINGTNTGRIFGISNTGLDVTFANLTLANGNATGYGGAIASDSTYGSPNKITIKNCIFKDNRASTNGGAIQFSGQSSNPPNLTISDSTFINNRANQGGAISNAASSSTITNSDFISNSAVLRGGVIYNNYGSFTVQFSRFIGNTAANGAVIWSDYGGNAPYNWWGSNTGPSAGAITASPVSVFSEPWLVLTAPTGITVAPNSNSVIIGNLQYDSWDTYHDPTTEGHIPDGIPVTFAGDTLGNISPLSGVTSNGLILANFTAGATPGVSHPIFSVDGSGAIAGNVTIAGVTPTNLAVNPASGNNGNSVNLIATLTNGSPISGQTVYYYLNGSLLGNATTNGSGIATLPYTITQGVGIHQILAQFLGDGVYSGSIGTNNLTVNYIPTNLVVNGPVNTNYRDVVNLTATLTDFTGGALYDKMVYFNVNGNYAGAAKTNGAGIATFQYTVTQGAGIYQLLATFLADTVYSGSNATNSFTLTPSTTSLTVEPKTGYYNNTVSLTANLTDTANNIPVSGKTINFSVNGNPVGSATTAANGIATLAYKPLLTQGTYEILAQFAGTTGYTGSNGTNNLTINLTPTGYYPLSTTFYVNYNNTVNLTTRLRDNNYNYLNNKTVSFSVNGTPIGSVVTNTISGSVGTATIPFTANLTPGTYQVLVQFAGDSIYNASNVTYNLVVNYNPTKLNVTAKSGIYNGKVNLTATLKDTLNTVMSGKTVYFYVNNSSSPIGSGITDALGVATYEYTIAQGAGVYPISAQFLAEGGYNASTNSSTLTVSPAQSYMSVNPASGYTGDNVALTANLWDINAIAVPGKFIDFYVDNIIQGTSQTDINGVATWIYTITQGVGVYPGFIKAVFAVDPYYLGATSFNTLTVIPDTVAPTANATPAGGLYNSAQNVVLAANEPATIYYTTNGSDPTTGSTQYTGPIVISANTVLKFFAVDTAGNPSGIYTETYTIDTVAPTVTANPVGGLYNTTQNVVLTANESATIYYTTDGSDPTTSATRLTYSGPIAISANTLLKFFAVDTAGNPSGIFTETYTIDTTAPTVTANPVGGTYSDIQTVTLTTTDVNPTTTYYTTDGSNPQTSSTRKKYAGPISISTTTTLKFYAIDAAGNPSPVYTETYTINLAPADLRTETVTTNGNTATGITNYPVSSIVKNYGGTITKTFYVSYYLSTDQYKSSNDRYIGHATVNGLASGSSVNAQILGLIPKDLAQGYYYIIAVADSTGIIPEPNEANNIKTSPSRIFIWRPDLSVQTVTPSGNTATGITNYTVSSTIKNGGSITTDTFYVSYYLSTDTTKSSNDRYIGHATVNGLNGWSTTTATANCTIPKDIAQGNYYIIAVADSTGIIQESNEANNAKTSSSRIFVWRPDLSVQTVTTGGNTARGATGYSVSSTIKNGGSITTDTFYVSYYLSTDTTKSSNDVYIGHATVNGLNGWSTTTATANCTIPVNITPGNYYIIAVADVTGVIPESNETNNNKVSATRIYIS